MTTTARPRACSRPGAHRGLMTEIPAQSNHNRLWVLFVQDVEQFGRRVPAAVVDQYHFVVKLG